MSGPDEPEGYTGRVTLEVATGVDVEATAHLVARFDPLAGRTVWSGRVDQALPPGGELVVLTPHGRGRAVAVELDVWGNTRLRGLGLPPFPVELLDGAPPSG